MRVLALGGCGQEGKTAVAELLKFDDVTELVIGDLNGEKAIEHANRLGPKARALQLDVNDRPKLLSAMDGADVIVSFVGPYYRFGRQILQSAIDARTNFVDICDDPDATVSELELDLEAKKACISAVIGMGCSPGWFNVIAAYGAQQLDEIEDFEIEWCVSVTDIEDTGVSAAMSHVFHMVSDDRPQFLDGKLLNVPAMSGEKKTYFPGFGEVTVYYVGHPEPTTLPRYYPSLRNATCRGAIPGIDDVLRNYRLFGLTSDVAIDIPGGRIRPRDLAAVLLGAAPMPPADQLPPPHGGGRVIVRGRKDGIFEERQYLIIDPLKMSPNTGCAAAVGTAMMGRGQITTKGVFAPEGGVEPATFLRELAKLGFTWEETIIRKGSLSI